MKESTFLYGYSILSTVSMFVLFVVAVILYIRFMNRNEHTLKKRVFEDISIADIYQAFEKEFNNYKDKKSSKCLINRDKRLFLKTPKHRMTNGSELYISVFRVSEGLSHLYQIQVGGYTFMIDEAEIVQVIVKDSNGSREIEGPQLMRHLKKSDSFLNKRKRITFEAIVDFLDIL